EPEAGDVVEAQFEPCPPDEELQEHHHRQLEARHVRLRKARTTGKSVRGRGLLRTLKGPAPRGNSKSPHFCPTATAPRGGTGRGRPAGPFRRLPLPPRRGTGYDGSRRTPSRPREHAHARRAIRPGIRDASSHLLPPHPLALRDPGAPALRGGHGAAARPRRG